MYKENPKFKGSGILGAIPQTDTCPNKCKDCFFQSGRSYLEPLAENLPNMPTGGWSKVIRINDGNDSNHHLKIVNNAGKRYLHKFYNTAVPFLDFNGPVVLTINPGLRTDNSFHKVCDGAEDYSNLMFVRFRCNTWNLGLADQAVRYYSEREVPVVLTFMAYHNVESIPDYTGVLPDAKAYYRGDYIERKRTTNSYWAITTDAWRKVMRRYGDNKWVHSCGKIEGERGDTHCRFCGNCLREYYATITRMETPHNQARKRLQNESI